MVDTHNVTNIAKSEYIDEVLGYLFDPENRRFDNWITRLCLANIDAYNDSTLQAYIYNGKIYKPLSQLLPDKSLHRKALHISLHTDKELFLSDLNIINQDRSFIKQALFTIIEPVSTLQDLRDAIPECLASAHNVTKNYKRQRDEVYTILDNPRALRQFNAILPRIKKYSIGNLLY